MELIDPIKWKHSKSRAIFAKYKATDYLDSTVETLTNDKFIRKQLDHQQINVNTITSVWASIKSIIGRWGKKEFPPNDWSSIGKRVAVHGNLFALIDYFLCQNVSAAEAERGFSVMKETKTPKRAVLSNKYLSNRLRIMLSSVVVLFYTRIEVDIMFYCYFSLGFS